MNKENDSQHKSRYMNEQDEWVEMSVKKPVLGPAWPRPPPAPAAPPAPPAAACHSQSILLESQFHAL